MNDTIKENLKSIHQFAILALDKHKRSGVKFSGVNYASMKVAKIAYERGYEQSAMDNGGYF
jgi:hypothetical protein